MLPDPCCEYSGDSYSRKGDLVGVLVLNDNGDMRYINRVGYDENGNRTVYVTQTGNIEGVYDPQDRLIVYGDYRYEYTDSGALSKKKDNNHTYFDSSDDTETTYSYDHGGNLLNVNLPNGTEIEYTVDATNRRIAKKVNGEFEYKLLYSGQLSPVARLDEKDNVVEQYVYATRVNVPDYMVKGGSYYRLLTDHRGSVRMVVNASTGEIVQETEYSEFGEITDETLAQGWEPVIFGYAGGLQDRHTGLIRFGARDYDPETGRWTSKEPLGFNGSSNFYAYADNDPVNKVDIDGNYALWDDAVFFVGGAIAGVGGQLISDVFSGNEMTWQNYAGAALGGGLGGVALLYTGPVGAGAITGAATNFSQQILNNGGIECFSVTELAMSTAFGAALGKIPGAKVKGVSAGRGNMNAVYKQMAAKFQAGKINNIAPKTAGKMFFGRAVDTGLYPASIAGGVFGQSPSMKGDSVSFIE